MSPGKMSRGRFTLETERLILRPYVPEDLPQLTELLGDEEGMDGMGGAFDAEASRSWLERNLERYERDGFGRYAMFMRDDDKSDRLVGDCGLIVTTVEGVREHELGWVVARGSRGQGFAPEAAAAWRDHAFGSLGIERFVSMIYETNIASRRVAEKIGMTFERIATWEDGDTYLMYSLHG